VQRSLHTALAISFLAVAVVAGAPSAQASGGGREPLFGSRDPLGLLPDYAMASNITLGTDVIAVWRCKVPSNTTVAEYQAPGRVSMSVAQAIAWMEKYVTPYFTNASRGRYSVEFIAGGTIALARDENVVACMERARARTNAPATNVVAFDNAHFNGGVATVGKYSCSSAGGCIYDAQRRLPPMESRRAAAVGGDVIGKNNKTIVHEIGHTLGWPHSLVDPAKPYENVWDVMSGFVRCVDYNLCTRGAQHTLAINRYHAGWIDPSEVRTHSAGSAKYQLAAPAKPGTQFVVVPLDPDRFLTVEARPARGIDRVLPFGGVAVHIIKPQPCSNASCVAMTERLQGPPTRDASTSRHVIRAGRSKTFHGTRIEVLASVGSGYEVRISK
jgi:M6 family metalloprotease-like protein